MNGATAAGVKTIRMPQSKVNTTIGNSQSFFLDLKKLHSSETSDIDDSSSRVGYLPGRRDLKCARHYPAFTACV